MKPRTRVIYLTLIALLTLPVVGTGRPDARAQGTNRVGLVVRHGDGSVITRCVEFSESEISGYEVLVRAGLSVVASGYSGMGSAICSIDGEGCSASNCFCECQGSPCVYWAYHHLVNGQWQYSGLGATNHMVHSGDVEGWAWGEGSMGSQGSQPPVIPFDQICAPPATDTPPPTDTPVPPTATLSPEPTSTSPPPTPEVWFRLDGNPVPAGTCTTVRWDTTYAQEVYLDEERVDVVGSREVCPTGSQEYNLRAVGAGGERVETLVLGVTGASLSPSPMPTPTPTLSSPASPQPAAGSAVEPSPTPSLAASPSPSPSPTAEPATAVSPSPSSTAQVVAVVPPLSSPTSAAQPTLAPTPTDRGLSSQALVGFVAFNVILIGLLGWLVIRLLRRR